MDYYYNGFQMSICVIYMYVNMFSYWKRQGKHESFAVKIELLQDSVWLDFFFSQKNRLTLHKYWLIIIIFLILKVGRAWSRVQGFVM